MRPLRPLLPIALAAAGVGLGACGSGTVSSDEPKATPPLTVPRTPGDTGGRILVNPSEQTGQSTTSTTTTTTTPASGGTTTTTAPAPSTPAPTVTAPPQSGGQVAPGTQTGGGTGGGGTQTTQAPSGGAQFQDFCNQNPGAC